MLTHSLGGGVFFSLQHFIAPALVLMACFPSRLEITACLHSQGTREAIMAVISTKEGTQAINILLLLEGKHELFDII